MHVSSASCVSPDQYTSLKISHVFEESAVCRGFSDASVVSISVDHQQGFGSGLDPDSIGPVDPDPDSIGPVDPDPDSESGSGSRRAKLTHKVEKKIGLQPQTLNLDLDPEKMNTDPKPCRSVY
jgi:hypothetical protein